MPGEGNRRDPSATVILGQCRSTQRSFLAIPDDEPRRVDRRIALATEYGRYGYRGVAALLRASGFAVNQKHIERLRRCEGLMLPRLQPNRRRLWMNDGS
jgi:hypothetical protein